MSNVTCQIWVSLDGYVAGAGQSREDPLGKGGERLHEWAFADDAPPQDKAIRDSYGDGVGAYIMGRNMFGPDGGAPRPRVARMVGRGPAVPRAGLRPHPPRPPPTRDGGRHNFTFVTDGIEAALEQARAAAGGDSVEVAGGASTMRQYLAAGLLDDPPARGARHARGGRAAT